eukprot:COSAG03_NODE_167_length_11280_cov_8.065468_5_plen_716_part_00
MSDMADQKAIIVAVRTRPLSLTERVNENEQVILPTTNPRVIKAVSPEDGKDNDYTLDHTFWEEHTNEDVYNTLGKQTLENAFNGYNGTIFAYGQTGSGKTHTMMGGEGEAAGIIPRLCVDIFKRIAESGVKAEVRCSYVEIYGQSEKLADLLLPEDAEATSLSVRQKGPAEYYVQGLTQYQPENATQMEMFIRAGSDRRACASTNMNDTSSRSHAVFIVELTQHIAGSRRTSQLKLVDLAGSENINKSGVTGQRQVEAVSINKALSTLRRVLDALTKQSKEEAKGTSGKKGATTHVPFRDSALTKLLADSMGGNCRTTMIAAVGPASYNYAESKNTLTWACKARKIKCQAVKNEKNDQGNIKSLKSEVEELRAKLAALEAGARKGGNPADAKELKALRSTLAEREAELKRELKEAREREEQLEKVKAETLARLDVLKQEYDESQENLGNARLAWKALVRNLKYEEERNKELEATVKELQAKLERYAAAEALEEREARVAKKEAVVGNVEQYEAVAKACKEEYEAKVDVVRAAEQSVEKREQDVANREHAVSEREAFLLKRDSYYSNKRDPTGGGSIGRPGSGREFTDAHAARERVARRSGLGPSASSRPGSGHVRVGAGPSGHRSSGSSGSSSSTGTRYRRGSFGSDLSNSSGGDGDAGGSGGLAIGTPQAMREAMVGGGLLAGLVTKDHGGGAGFRKGTGFQRRAGITRPVFGR